MHKMSVEQIRERFDKEVERFSNLETGQSAIPDAPLMLELVTAAAAAVTPQARTLLDIGCGAGNYTLKMLGKLPNLDVTLVDLSEPMLARAVARVQPQTQGRVTTLQGDVRQLDLGREQFDVVIASAVLHHLRTDAEWEAVYGAIWRALKPGGSYWGADLIEHDQPAVQAMMWARYGDYLVAQKGPEYRDTVYEYVGREDTPRSLEFQFEVMRRVGFRDLTVLHKTSVFAAYGGLKVT